MVNSALDVLRGHTGVADGPELIAAVQRLSEDEVSEIAEAIGTRPPEPEVTPARGEAWPLITARASTFSTAAGTKFSDAPGSAGLNLTAAMNPRDIGSGRFSNSVMQALLYCHGLVIEDPLAMAAELYVTSPAHVRRLAHSFINAATVSMVEVSALLDSRVVQTFFTPSSALPDLGRLRDAAREELAKPDARFGTAEVWEAFEASYVDGLSPALQELWQQVGSGNRQPSLDLVESGLGADGVAIVETFIEVLAQLRPDGVIDNCLDIVISSVAAQTALGSRHDLFCPTSLFTKLLFLGAPDPLHELRLHELARMDVPGIPELRIDDAVRIRHDSEAFDQWRRSLSTALERAHALRDQLGAVDTTAIVAESIADARNSIFKELSGTRAFARTTTTSFVAGALGGAVGAATGGSAGILLGALGGLLPAAVQAITEARQRPAGYLRRHYFVFEKADSSSHS